MTTRTTPAVPSITRAQLTAVARKYLATRTATLGFTLHDHRTNVKLDYQPFTNEVASTMKVLILCTALRVSQEKKIAFSAAQRRLATQMIEYSDNNSASKLFWGAGGPTATRRVAGLLGLSHTVVNSAWGITRTVPADWGHLMDQIVQGTPVLTDANRAYIMSLMSQVTKEQRWGVANPPITAATRALTKNGWLPYKGVWRVNSTGYIEGGGRKYTLAILSQSPKGYTYGVSTLNGLSSTIYTALAKHLVA